MKQLLVLLAMLLVIPAAIAEKNSIEPIDMKLSGSLIHVDDGGLFEIHLK